MHPHLTLQWMLIIALVLQNPSHAFHVGTNNLQRFVLQRQMTYPSFLMMSDNSGNDADAISRRRKRRGKETTSEIKEKTGETGKQQVTITPESVADVSDQTSMGASPKVAQDGTSSLEDIFGLGSNQLRELMEQELPVPREDLVTKKVVKAADKNKVFKLPDLNEWTDAKDDKNDKESTMSPRGEEVQRVDRSNRDEYLRVLQLNPYADADDTMFFDEYDIIPAVFGTGKLLNIPIPYLQTGHGILLAATLLAALVYAPGNPLTEFPPEVTGHIPRLPVVLPALSLILSITTPTLIINISPTMIGTMMQIRIFLRQGLMVTYSINAVLAVRAFGIAKSKNLPAVFWAVKSFLCGGVAFYEITQAKDPKDYELREDANMIKPSDRKSKR